MGFIILEAVVGYLVSGVLVWIALWAQRVGHRLTLWGIPATPQHLIGLGVIVAVFVTVRLIWSATTKVREDKVLNEDMDKASEANELNRQKQILVKLEAGEYINHLEHSVLTEQQRQGVVGDEDYHAKNGKWRYRLHRT